MNGTFDPTYSSNQIWMDTNLNECLTTHLDGIEGDVSSLQSNKADVNHTHSYNSLTDKPTIPTTLPANGGNADTVDGKHASSFATASSVSILQTLVDGIVDIVIDEGMSGGWTYRKWKSGIMEQWAKVNVMYTWTTWSTWYEGVPTGVTTFGIAFADAPNVTANCVSGTWGIPFVQDITATNFKMYCTRPNAGTTTGYYTYSVYAIGRWK